MSQHSPFPWSEGESFVFDASGQAICREYSHNLNWKDDRALIAAIPEMVAALEALVGVCGPNIYPQPDKPESAWAKLESARAVLQKVTK
jgi:hypothetical protein